MNNGRTWISKGPDSASAMLTGALERIHGQLNKQRRRKTIKL